MNQKLKPGTRRFIALMLGLTVLLLLGGGIIWFLAFSRFNELQQQAAAIASGKAKPSLSQDDLERLYRQGSQSYEAKDYAPAIESLKPITDFQSNYKESAPLLLLSYKALGEIQAGDLAKLEFASQTFDQALTLAQILRPQLTQQFATSPKLLPENSGSFDNLLKNLEQQKDWAGRYARGQAGKPETPDSWDTALTEWETLFRDNPDYLKPNPTLWVGARLMDTYEAKATYLCRIKGSYSEAMFAANRAYEIGFKNKVADTRQKSLRYLLNFLNQSQCQEG